MSRQELADYINDQIASRRWSKRELARQANLANSSVLRATSADDDTPIGFDILFAIATALRIRPERLFIMAGLFPREPQQTTDERHLLNTFRQLPAEHQRTLIEYCDYLFTVRSRLFPSYGPDYEEEASDDEQ